MESTPVEQIVNIDGANKDVDAEQKGQTNNKVAIPEENTEVSAN